MIPEAQGLYFSLSEMYALLDKEKDALDSLQKAIEFCPSDLLDRMKAQIKNSERLKVLKDNPKFKKLIEG